MSRTSLGILKIFTRWALLECDDQIGAMYRALYTLEYFYKPKIQRPLWGSHISIIRGETILDENVKAKWQDKIITYDYTPVMETNGVHFWLPVNCPVLDEIRADFKLPPTYVNYHLSIGNIVSGTGYTDPINFGD